MYTSLACLTALKLSSLSPSNGCSYPDLVYLALLDMGLQWHHLLGLAVFLTALSYQYRDDIRAFVSGPVGDGLLRPRGGEGEGTGGPITADAPQHKTQTKTETRDQTNKQAEETKQQPMSTTEGGMDSPALEETPPTPEYYNPTFDPTNPVELFSESGTRLVTLNELAAHGHSGPLKPIWLAMLGNVFDVGKGERYYGPDGGYNFFSGRDGTRAFVTGQFDEEGLVDDVEGLSPLQLGEVDSWVKMYNKDYTYVGKLIGRYYNRDGSPTKAWYKYKKLLGEQEKMKAEQKKLEKQFPGCNSKWNEKEGGVVFCSEKR